MTLFALSIPMQIGLYLIDVNKHKLPIICREHDFANMTKRKKIEHYKMCKRLLMTKKDKYGKKLTLWWRDVQIWKKWLSMGRRRMMVKRWRAFASVPSMVAAERKIKKRVGSNTAFFAIDNRYLVNSLIKHVLL